ncbi:MAG TPA: type II secretion system protein [Myxococcales bacterium]|jgi:prepilin-type N-terminal cleavage/methylation domain-containing protein|nr:type II secretion system protein [Myxococcales bacterium]
MDQTTKRRVQRGFTLIEVMLVVVIIGILSSLAIPFYARASARAYRAESQLVLSKLEIYFRSVYLNSTGSTPTFKGTSVVSSPDIMPDPGKTQLIGQGVEWKPNKGGGWDDVPFPPQGNIRMRYLYSVASDGQSVTLSAYGRFPGFGANNSTPLGGSLQYNYSFSETLVGSGNNVSVDDGQTVVFPPTGVNAKNGQTDF